MSNEATKSAVLAKCEEVAPEVGKTYEMSKGTILKTNDRQVGDRFTEYRVDEYRDGSWVGLAFCDETPADSYVWALAADILKITPSIDEFEDDLSRRQYHHDLEVARKEGYEQGSKVAIGIANIANDALGLPRVFVDGEAVEVAQAEPEPDRLSRALSWMFSEGARAGNSRGGQPYLERNAEALAQVLATLKQPEPPRPSDALLLKCWAAALIWWEDRGEVRLGKPSFHEWLATLPADPLKADRELVKNIFRVSKFVTVSPEMKLWASIARLSGMEVGNG